MTVLDDNSNIYENSAVVVAHPDDEILWLSSILAHVDKIIFCFKDFLKETSLGIARDKVIREYPLSNVISLDIDEAGSFNTADWNSPHKTSYGLEIIRDKFVRECYKNNYNNVSEKLRSLLAGTRNVFTHNPWGEYGHEDHIQVYRIIKALQNEMDYDIWYSNYCSNRSMNLMLEYISGFSSNYISLPTDMSLAEKIAAIYKKHGCWTWYKDYQWFKEESLIRDTPSIDKRSYGHIFPINFIKVDFATTGTSPYFGKVLSNLLRRRRK